MPVRGAATNTGSGGAVSVGEAVGFVFAPPAQPASRVSAKEATKSLRIPNSLELGDLFTGLSVNFSN